MTLLLNRTQVESLLDSTALAAKLRDGFISYSNDRTCRGLRTRSSLPAPGTVTVLYPGLVPGAPVYAVKVHAKFPDQRPAIRGVLCLHSLHDGELLAIMDSAHLTAVRTGVAAALAADTLSRPDAGTVAVVGAGVQGRQQLMSLSSLRSIRSVTVYDSSTDAAQQFSVEMSDRLRLLITPADSVEHAVRGADIVLVATWSRTPFIYSSALAPGAHVNSLGADEPGKAELSACAIRSSTFFCDDRDLAVEMGALAGVGLTREHVAAEIGEVLAGTHPGRTSNDQLTVYGSVGLVFQDAVCAWQVYQSAVAKCIGDQIDFLA
jgi:ornithine cyclodeaminase/alanine dehydrogenase-like protein (mu-crystallin family)